MRLPARRNYFQKSRNSRWVIFFHHWNCITWMRFWTFHNIQINFKPGRIITNTPLHFPERERWIPLFSLKMQANCIFLINHHHANIFCTWAVNTAFPCTTTHTARTVYKQTSLLTSVFSETWAVLKPLSPQKHVTHKTETLQSHFFQERNSERTPTKNATQNNRDDYFVPVKKTLVGPILPTPYVPYIIGSKNLGACMGP